MSMSILRRRRRSVMAATDPGDGGVAPFFADNFEGGQLNAPMQAGPGDGFTYYFNGGDPTVSNLRAVNGGTHSLRMPFGPDADGADSTCEVRFRLGRAVRTLWVEYWLYVPDNFQMRELVNNKWFSIWRDVDGDENWSYGGWNSAGTTPTTEKFTIEYWGRVAPGPQAYLRAAARINGEFYVTDIKRPDFSEFAEQYCRLISPTGPVVVGQWNRIRMCCQASSADGVNDGAFTLWANDTKVQDLQGLALYNPHQRLTGAGIVAQTPLPETVFDCGYLLGYANTGFAELTELFLGDLKFYDVNPGWS